ncbi:acyl-CoA synthetase [Erythrobacter sp. Dej080120_24]|uniref:acyl-CoA synthetase n=1 Tax=Erythrobacter sp. Dej080120_24 TaxID=3024837 RepID=UPI002925AB31|nr:acyl-CoA synthetase [Erythrobacter sp. Dej080120_24]
MSNNKEWHLANVWESVADAMPDEAAVTLGDRTISWREYDERAARLAKVLIDGGLKPGAKVAIYSYNSIEYLEAQYAAFKARLVPINVNYRYLEGELAHVFNNSDSEAIVFQASFAPRIAAIRDQLESAKLFVEIDDGSGEHLDGALRYEEAIADVEPMERIERSGDDIYMLYTGGTTGLPKGVMYDHRTFTTALIGKAMMLRELPFPETPDGLGPVIKGLAAAGFRPKSLPSCPLMHGTGMWVGVTIPHSLGGHIVLEDNRSFDPDGLLQLIQDSKAREIVIVGDVFAKPMIKALHAAKGRSEPYDLSNLMMINSSGVMFSAEAKQGLLEFADVTIFDSMGSTEGSMGTSISNRETIGGSQTGKFQLSPTTKIFTEDGREVEPGSGEVGLICNGGMVPIGYYKDEKKSAETFKTINGVRYSVPGDFATLEADGTITLLGRGSGCINSGGEKIFPEEVEEAIKSHDQIVDCLVVGVPDDRFGECVTAVFSTDGGGEIADADMKSHVRSKLADYKAPRHYVKVDRVPRADNGKADYKTAKSLALTQLGLD